MGGFGSGSWQSGRVTVEASPYLDVNILRREGLLVPNCRAAGTFSWSTWYEEVQATFTLKTSNSDGVMVLQVPGETDQHLRFTSSPAPLGGHRWWFECPSRDIRVCRLYRPPGGRRFASRKAWRLVYASTRLQPYERALRRAQQIRRRLGGAPSLDAPWPLKPKWMRQATYRQHLATLEQLEATSEAHLANLIAALSVSRGGFE